MEPENKTSDEILEELFSALNVPLSPKTKVVSVDNKNNAHDSDGSEDKEPSSKSSGSEEDIKEKVEKNHKHKSSKKKKEKKKKKKKHKKKDEDSRHKSKKKHKRDSVVESDDASSPKIKAKATETEGTGGGDISSIIQEHLEKSSNGHHKAAERVDSSNSRSPKSGKEVLESLESQIKDVSSEKVGKEHVKKPLAKLNSPERSHSSSKSLRSRSRSTSKVRQRHSRSRSRSKHFRHSRSRSRSRTKHDHHSRSSSRTKSSSYKSRTKSPRGLEIHKRKRSRSHSKSLSPKLYKRRRSSRSHSRSFSPKSSKRRFSKSRSKSRSPRLFRRRRSTRSRSLSPLKRSSRQRSRSRSGSYKRSIRLTETVSSSSRKLDSAQKQETVKEEKAILDIDLNSIPTPAIKPESSSLPIALESIPLPVPLAGVPDPSSIPLPQPVTPSELQSGKDGSKAVGAGIDVGTIPVPVATAEIPTKEQELIKQVDTGSEKGKAKTIIIKSLKDSLIYLQAQEEAERRAKVKQDDEPEVSEEDEVGESEDEINEEKEENELEDIKSKDNDASEKEMENNVEVADKKEIKEEKKNDKEEGELSSEEEGDEKSKSHKKKSKKDKDKSKEKKKAKKEKNKDKDKKKRSRERSRSKERSNKSRSRSKSKERSRHKRHSSGSWHRDRDSERRHRRYSRSRSRSRDRFSRFRRRSYSRSRSRSRSRSGRKRDCVTDLRDKVTRKRLLEIARRNAVYLMQNGCLPPSVEQEQLVKIKTGGKSVEELTDFCKQLVASGNYSDVELSDPSLSSDEEKDKDGDKPFTCTRHPFSVRDSKPILMNIRNAPMLPTKTNAERLADHAKLREQFPVSSGSQHRNKGEVINTEDKHRTAESGWVPVSPKEKKPKEEDSVFSKEAAPAVDISQIVSSRLSAMRKLQDNPHDVEALNTLRNVQKEMQSWALSKQEPGQFTGSTGVKILSQEELCAGQQAWVRKEQFKEAAPVRPQFGLKMLQKMGWTPGEGLGKNKEGAIEPLLLDVKMDKKGFHAQEELTPKKQPIPMAKDLSGKHPVSALVEYCSKHKWQPPQFEMVFDYGPDHKKNFLMKVRVNGQEYKPAVAGPTKKLAKANAAAACLQSLGLFPKDPENPITEAAS